MTTPITHIIPPNGEVHLIDDNSHFIGIDLADPKLCDQTTIVVMRKEPDGKVTILKCYQQKGHTVNDTIKELLANYHYNVEDTPMGWAITYRR